MSRRGHRAVLEEARNTAVRTACNGSPKSLTAALPFCPFRCTGQMTVTVKTCASVHVRSGADCLWPQGLDRRLRRRSEVLQAPGYLVAGVRHVRIAFRSSPARSAR